MCGIAGMLSDAATPTREAVEATLRPLAHRGPDGSGVWLDPAAGIGLGHRRLAVLDLSEAGHQPMASADGRWVVVFNGELFGHDGVREELGRRAWRGHSDTEVLVEGLARWGVEATLERVEGQFAIAAWDRHQRVLHLARDRFGEKPLYYGRFGRTFAFGSELGALRAVPGFDPALDDEALAAFLRFGYVPHPLSIHRAVRKLAPGARLAVSAGAPLPEPTPYWDPDAAILRALAEPRRGADDALLDELDALLRDTVRSRMVADVPLGALLSGGIDSSLVTALMVAQGGRVKTFSIGFEEPGFDEAKHAAAIARHLGTDHTEHYVSPADCLAVVPELPRLYDEPFADPSQIPTLLVARLARRQVTVALSGDAGDEIFGGYNRYFHGPGVWRRVSRVPRAVRRATARALRVVGPAGWNRGARALRWLLPAELTGGRGGEKAHKLAGVLGARDEDDYHAGLLSQWANPERVVASGARGLRLPHDRPPPAALQGLAARAMAVDTRNYLPDDVLTKVDRATMAVSLEGRAPFLDRRVFDLAWRLPWHLRVADGRGKIALRRVLDRYVPRALVERPKMGFAVPVGRWLRAELRGWAEDLLSERALAREGLFRPEPVRVAWQEHLTGRRDHDGRLWAVLIAQSWHATQRRSEGA